MFCEPVRFLKTGNFVDVSTLVTVYPEQKLTLWLFLQIIGPNLAILIVYVSNSIDTLYWRFKKSEKNE